MPRSLSAAITAAVATKAPATAHLLDLTVDGTPHYIADRSIVFGGNSYAPGLTVDSGIRLHRSLQLDGGTVKIQNVTRFFSVLQANEFIPGSPAVLRRLYLQAQEALVIFDGVCDTPAIDELNATLKLVSRLDPTARRIPTRTYGPLCAWRYKSPECGSVSGEALCPKTFDACVVREATHRFSGFVHIDRELQESVPAPPVVPARDPNEDFLGNFDHGFDW